MISFNFFEKSLGTGSTAGTSKGTINNDNIKGGGSENMQFFHVEESQRERSKQQQVFRDQDGTGINIVWEFDQHGQNSDGGWSVTENGMVIMFKVEDSGSCVQGGNSREQRGTANGMLMILEKALPLYFALGGMGEMLDSGFESLILSIDGKVVASATSNGRGLACSSGAAKVTYFTESVPMVLSAGMHTINLTFTTFDDYDHRGVFYELHLARTRTAARNINLHSPYMTLPPIL